MSEIPFSLTYPGIVSKGVPHEVACRLSDAVRGILAPEAGLPTVRVRISVAVDEHGEWEVATRNEVPAEAATYLRGRIAWSFVEADVPPPLAPQTVLGHVTASAEEE